MIVDLFAGLAVLGGIFHLTGFPVRQVCADCGAHICWAWGYQRIWIVSHGMCEACYQAMEKRYGL